MKDIENNCSKLPQKYPNVINLPDILPICWLVHGYYPLVEQYGTHTAVNAQIRTVSALYFTVIQVGVLRPYFYRNTIVYDRYTV